VALHSPDLPSTQSAAAIVVATVAAAAALDSGSEDDPRAVGILASQQAVPQRLLSTMTPPIGISDGVR